MKMSNALCGALCGVLVFAVLSWTAPLRIVKGAVLSSPPEGRFQLVQLHPSAESEWSGILDTETGCTWIFVTNNPDDPKITNPSYKMYLQVLGTNGFSLVNFDTTEYTYPALNSDKQIDYSKPLKEITRVQDACSQARLLALKEADTR